MKKITEPEIVREASLNGGYHWLLEILIFICVFLVGNMAETIPLLVPTVVHMAINGISVSIEQLPDWMMILSLYSTALMTVIVILFCVYIQKRTIRTVGFCKEAAIREYLVGALIGIVLFGLTMLICWATGSISFQTQRFSVFVWLLYLIGFLFQGMSEEVLCRGYFLVSIARKNNLFLAVFLSSLSFSLFHIFNQGVTFLALVNILLFGVLMALYFLKRGNIWGVCGIHSLWNFVQGNVFGVQVSGMSVSASPIIATASESRKIWNGGTFGAEGGLAVTIVLIVGIMILLLFVGSRTGQQKKTETVPIEKQDEANIYNPFS